MTAVDIIRELQGLDPAEVAKVRDWLTDHVEETPAMIAAVDEGLESLAQRKARVVSRQELETKVKAWSGASR